MISARNPLLKRKLRLVMVPVATASPTDEARRKLAEAMSAVPLLMVSRGMA